MRPQKITFGDMREMGVRGVLVYCADYRCSHSMALSADRWPDEMRLSDVEPRFEACGKRGADVRPDFNWNKPRALWMHQDFDAHRMTDRGQADRSMIRQRQTVRKLVTLRDAGEHHEAAEGRARCARMASRDGGADPGGRAWRSDHVRQDRDDAGLEPREA